MKQGVDGYQYPDNAELQTFITTIAPSGITLMSGKSFPDLAESVGGNVFGTFISPTIQEKVENIAWNVAQEHCLNDANKRLAGYCVDWFIKNNGINYPIPDMESFVKAVMTKKESEQA